MHIVNSDPLFLIASNKEVIVENNEVRLATRKDSIVRFFNWKKANRQDENLAEYLINHLNHSQKSEYHGQLLNVASNLTKSCRKTQGVYKRLENTIFAHKCNQLLSIHVGHLIHSDGTIKNEAFSFIKNNFLHYGIAKANGINKETAILFHDQNIYIRAKKGESFLEDALHVDRILSAIPKNHPDRQTLKLLQKEYTKTKKNLNRQRIDELKGQLKDSHYFYTKLEDIPRDGKGVMISQSYFIKGVETHDVCKWKKVKNNFVEEASEAGYKLRVITRLPEYSFAKTWSGFAISIFRNLLNFRAHGHSWIQLVKPIYDKQGEFTGKQHVIDIGYYFHPLDSKKRYQNADPMSAMPIPAKQKIIEEFSISKRSYKRGVVYLNELQGMMRKKGRKLTDQPTNRFLGAKDVKNIKLIFQATLKSTCLGFANAMKLVLTGKQTDDRGALRRLVMPKSSFAIWDRLNPLIEKTVLLKRLFSPLMFLSRMELPYFVRGHDRKQNNCNCAQG